MHMQVFVKERLPIIKSEKGVRFCMCFSAAAVSIMHVVGISYPPWETPSKRS